MDDGDATMFCEDTPPLGRPASLHGEVTPPLPNEDEGSVTPPLLDEGSVTPPFKEEPEGPAEVPTFSEPSNGLKRGRRGSESLGGFRLCPLPQVAAETTSPTEATSTCGSGGYGLAGPPNEHDSVQWLINSKVDVNAANSAKSSALSHAVSNQNVRMVHSLLEGRADPNHIKKNAKGVRRTLLDVAENDGAPPPIINMLEIAAGELLGSSPVCKRQDGCRFLPHAKEKPGSAYAERSAFKKAYARKMLPLVGEKPILDFSAYKGAYQTNVKATDGFSLALAQAEAPRRIYAGLELPGERSPQPKRRPAPPVKPRPPVSPTTPVSPPVKAPPVCAKTAPRPKARPVPPGQPEQLLAKARPGSQEADDCVPGPGAVKVEPEPPGLVKAKAMPRKPEGANGANGPPEEEAGEIGDRQMSLADLPRLLEEGQAKAEDEEVEEAKPKVDAKVKVPAAALPPIRKLMGLEDSLDNT
eukprot:g1619.t1